MLLRYKKFKNTATFIIADKKAIYKKSLKNQGNLSTSQNLIH